MSGEEWGGVREESITQKLGCLKDQIRMKWSVLVFSYPNDVNQSVN